MQLLHIDSSISGGQSVSRQLSAGIVTQLKQTNPALDIVYRDLADSPVPLLTEQLHIRRLKVLSEADESAETAAYTAQGQDIAELQLQQETAIVIAALNEFLAADIVVIGAPMYNFSIPSQLKAWIDCLVAPGKTFRYTQNGIQGLIGGKRIIVASARGNLYSAPSPTAALDHQESYLSSIFDTLGASGIDFVRAEGVNLGSEQRQQALDSALAEIATLN